VIIKGERNRLASILFKMLDFLEIKPMNDAISKAIQLLANKITSDIKSEDALRYTQAALNLAHVLQCNKSLDS